MDGSLHRVVLLDVDLGQLVALDARSVLDITQSRRLDDVADNEALDGLVLGDGLARRHATHAVDVAAALLVTSVGATLDGHTDKVGQGKASGQPEWLRKNHTTALGQQRQGSLRGKQQVPDPGFLRSAESSAWLWVLSAASHCSQAS